MQQCLSNQRQISHALRLFYNEHKTYPSDDPSADLAAALAEYIETPAVFKCPCDTDPESTNSYQPYYVQRREAGLATVFSVGCPRHRNGRQAPTLFGDGSVQLAPLAKVIANGLGINQSRPCEHKTIQSGQFVFEDGGTLSITSAQPDFAATLIESFRLGDGSLYTVVRVSGDGSIDCSVPTGSRFEVVTPSAVVGVKGTEFTVVTTNSGKSTSVSVTQGKVWARDRVRGHVRELGAGQLTSLVNDSPSCLQCPKHCKGTKHCHMCPLSGTKDKSDKGDKKDKGDKGDKGD